jgi:hypothetical protein
MNIFSRKKPAEGSHRIFNLIILDESGSMSSIQEETMEGLKSVFSSIREGMERFPDQDHSISLLSFSSDRMKEILWNEPVHKIPDNFTKKYCPQGGTPLYDAIGYGLTKLRKTVGALSADGYNVLVTILTDGEENASEEFSYSQIKSMIEEFEKGPWTFAFIGASLNAYEVARSLSIRNAMNYEASSDGIAQLFQVTRQANLNFMKGVSEQRINWDAKEGFFDLTLEEKDDKEKP